jgi:hypothetical protein
MVTIQSEASARTRIDTALESSGWDLLNQYEVRTSSVRADYFLHECRARLDPDVGCA